MTDKLTPYALVRRHPLGGYAVVHSYVEVDGIPEVDADLNEKHMTLQHACDTAASFGHKGAQGFYSIHPECYRTQTKMIGGL